MKIRPIHENLDTSFVNLSALIDYLRRRRFVGRVRVEMSGYEADVNFLAGGKISVREHDRIAGRLAHGEEALLLRQLLARAREPGGTIHVYQTIPTTITAAADDEQSAEVGKNLTPPEAKLLESNPPPANGSAPGAAKPENGSQGAMKIPPAPAVESNLKPPRKSFVKQSDFPFSLSNRVEEKAREIRRGPSAPQEWRTLLGLAAELLGAVDAILAEAKLNFAGALMKTRREIAPDYPFLNPAAEIFNYSAGSLTMSEPVNAKVFAAGLNEVLRRILEKLGASRKYSEVYRAVVQKILALIHLRRPLYEKYFITPQLERIVGA